MSKLVETIKSRQFSNKQILACRFYYKIQIAKLILLYLRSNLIYIIEQMSWAIVIHRENSSK